MKENKQMCLFIITKNSIFQNTIIWSKCIIFQWIHLIWPVLCICLIWFYKSFFMIDLLRPCKRNYLLNWQNAFALNFLWINFQEKASYTFLIVLSRAFKRYITWCFFDKTNFTLNTLAQLIYPTFFIPYLDLKSLN